MSQAKQTAMVTMRPDGSAIKGRSRKDEGKCSKGEAVARTRTIVEAATIVAISTSRLTT